MKIVFVVVTYNAEGFVRDLFSTLAAFTDLTHAHILVVDNASRDRTLEELRTATAGWTNVEILPQARNTGFAAGNNIGIRRARESGAEYVVLLNQDLELTPAWLEPLLDVMAARPDVAAAQPLVLLHDRPELVNTAGNHLHFCGFGYCGAFLSAVSSLPDTHSTWPVAFASGAALVLRMRALERSGDFDETLFLYHEDCELQVRLRMLGYDCVVVPASRVLHKYVARFSAWKYAQLDRNRWLVLLKDWPWDRLLVAAPALVGTELAVLIFALKKGWFGRKLASYAELAWLLPRVLRDRWHTQRLRSATATDGAVLTGAMQFEGLDHPLITRVANPVLSAYWNLARRVLRVR